MNEYKLEALLEEARTDEDFKTDSEILAEELRNIGHMTDLGYYLLMAKEDEHTARRMRA